MLDSGLEERILEPAQHLGASHRSRANPGPIALPP